MKSITNICLAVVAAVTLAAFSATAQTNTAPSADANTPSKASTKSMHGMNYTGKVTAADADAKTITISTKKGDPMTLRVDSKTKFKKDGESAVMSDAAVGQSIYGTYHKNDSGDMVASTVNIGMRKHKASTTSTNTPPAATDTK